MTTYVQLWYEYIYKYRYFIIYVRFERARVVNGWMDGWVL